jgi:hypothetical protein
VSYRPLSDDDLGERYTPRTIKLLDECEYGHVLEEQCRRANRLAEVVNITWPDARREHIWKDGSPGVILGVEEWHRILDALRAYLGDRDD